MKTIVNIESLRYKNIYFFFVLSTIFSSILSSQNLNLKIKGKDSLETLIIDSLSYAKKFNDVKSLNLELDSVIDKLQRKGFIECELVSTERKSDSVFLSKIYLKKKFYTIYIYIPKNSISSTLLNNVSDEVTPEYFVIPISKSEEALNYLNTEIANQGDPFSSFKLENISKRDNSNLKANLVLDSSKKRAINKIVIKGYEAFPRSFLKHFLKIKTKSDFNLIDVKEKIEGLNNLSFANQLKSPEVLFTKDSTTVYLYLDKSKSNSFVGFLGF